MPRARIPASIRSITVSTTFTRAYCLSSASTSCHGAALVVGALQHLLDRLRVLRALTAVLPVVRSQLPGLQRVVAALLEALQLLLVGDVQEELDQHHPLGRQRPLQLDDLAVGALPLLRRREALHALDQHAPVPGAVEHGHAAPAGQLRPEAPQVVVALLVRGRRRELRHAHVARVERRHEPLDRPALAGGVPALEQHADRRAEPVARELAAERQPQRLQPLPGRRRAAPPPPPSTASATGRARRGGPSAQRRELVQQPLDLGRRRRPAARRRCTGRRPPSRAARPPAPRA